MEPNITHSDEKVNSMSSILAKLHEWMSSKPIKLYDSADYPTTVKQDSSLKIVPEEFRPHFIEAAKHANVPVNEYVMHSVAENGGNFDPKLRGQIDPNDYGIMQMSPQAVQEITKPREGGKSFFEQNYGEKFNPEDPRHQIVGSSVYMNFLKQYSLPEAGIKNPTADDIRYSYNMGAKGYADFKAGKGDATSTKRYETYKKNLEKGKSMLPVD